jgi:division/cell wall cluster transcriptional repressor MraZ
MIGINGTYDVAIDEKNRFVFPAKWRNMPEYVSSVYYVTIGRYSSLDLFPEKEWENFQQEFPSSTKYKVLVGALDFMIRLYLRDVQLDKQDRIMLYPNHMELLKLKGKTVRLVGNGDRIKIYNPETHDRFASDPKLLTTPPDKDSFDGLLAQVLGEENLDA